MIEITIMQIFILMIAYVISCMVLISIFLIRLIRSRRLLCPYCKGKLWKIEDPKGEVFLKCSKCRQEFDIQ